MAVAVKCITKKRGLNKSKELLAKEIKVLRVRLASSQLSYNMQNGMGTENQKLFGLLIQKCSSSSI